GSVTLSFNKIVGKTDKVVNFSGGTSVNFYQLYTQEGLRVSLPFASNFSALPAGTGSFGVIDLNTTLGGSSFGHDTNGFFLMLTEEDKDGNLGLGGQINITVSNQSDADAEVNSITMVDNEAFKEIEDDDNLVSRVESDLGTKYRRIGSSTDQRWVEITYPGEESYAEVFIAAPDLSVGTGGGTSEIKTFEDTEVDSVSSKNLIVIGGTCVNTVAQRLFAASSALCGADFSSHPKGVGADEFLIETFSSPYSSGVVATLVAGYEAADTTKAVDALTSKKPDTDVGMRYEGDSSGKFEKA
ncbi:MAG: hypothetical protein AABY07_10360, partial [Nanoarchaeota archaeon]